LQNDYWNKVHFVYIYIEEAHAEDEWPLSTEFTIKQHKTIEERLTAARRLVEEFGSKITVLVDTMANEFNQKFFVWPERWFLLDPEGKLLRVGSPNSNLLFVQAKHIRPHLPGNK